MGWRVTLSYRNSRADRDVSDYDVCELQSAGFNVKGASSAQKPNAYTDVWYLVAGRATTNEWGRRKGNYQKVRKPWTACVNNDAEAFGIVGHWKEVVTKVDPWRETVKDAAETLMTEWCDKDR